MLPSGRVLPKFGRLHVEILPAIPPSHPTDTTEAAAGMRDQSRAAIVARLGEPDLLEKVDAVAPGKPIP
jgi:hypothetical protein